MELEREEGLPDPQPHRHPRLSPQHHHHHLHHQRLEQSQQIRKTCQGSNHHEHQHHHHHPQSERARVSRKTVDKNPMEGCKEPELVRLGPQGLKTRTGGRGQEWTGKRSLDYRLYRINEEKLNRATLLVKNRNQVAHRPSTYDAKKTVKRYERKQKSKDMRGGELSDPMRFTRTRGQDGNKETIRECGS